MFDHKENGKLTEKGYCKVCSFYTGCSWLRGAFEKRVREGYSLRRLQSFCEGQGLECDTKTLSKHIKNCMGLEVREQRKIEKALRKVKDPLKRVWKLKDFFRPESTPQTECPHLATTKEFRIDLELVEERCSHCGKVLGHYSVERAERQDRRKNMVIYTSLKRRERASKIS